MIYKIATKLLAFIVAALQAEARRAAKDAGEFGQDICAVEAQRVSLVKQANARAAAVTIELAASQADRRKAAAQATVLAANLSSLTAMYIEE
jgi:hypothetical protein